MTIAEYLGFNPILWFVFCVFLTGGAILWLGSNALRLVASTKKMGFSLFIVGGMLATVLMLVFAASQTLTDWRTADYQDRIAVLEKQVSQCTPADAVPTTTPEEEN